MKTKKILAVALTLSLTGILAGWPVSAAQQSTSAMRSAETNQTETATEKEESIYGILASDGSVKTLYVVNTFPAGGAITDYGIYSDLKNLTGTETIQTNGDKIQIDGGENALRYQGTLIDGTLPWDIAVTYTLDGREITADQLAGKSGALQIHLTVKPGDSSLSSFYSNYALQTTVSLDTALCTSISAPGASAVDAGGKRQLVYTILPGKGADVTISADVEDFEMDSITLNGIRMNLNFTVDTASYTEQIRELSDAIAQIDSGAGDLSSGVQKLSDGITQYAAGVKTWQAGVADLTNGAVTLQTGADTLKSGANQLALQGDSLVGTANAIMSGTFDQVNANLAATGLGLPTLTPDNYGAVLGGIPDLASVKAQLDQAVLFASGVKAYTDGVKSLADGAGQVADGANGLASGATSLSNGADELYNSAVKLSSAVLDLRTGLLEYKSGTHRLAEETDGMDEQIDEQISDLMDSISGDGSPIVSYVSDRNSNVSSVQFLLKTDAIQIVSTENTVPTSVENLTFWDRLLALFGL